MNQKRVYKRLFVLSILSILMLSMFIGVVSAQSTSNAFQPIQELASGAVNSFTTFAKPLLAALFGSSLNTGDELSKDFLLKFFFFLIVFAFVYVVLAKSMATWFDDHKWALWLVSLIVPFLGVRFLSAEWLETMLLPQQAFFVAFISLIPFVLIFFLTKDWTSPSARRAAWVVFAVILFFMWTYSMQTADSTNDLPAGLEVVSASPPLPNYGFIYIIAALAALAMAIFDGTIAKFRYNMQIERIKGGHKYSTLIQYQTQMTACTTNFQALISANNIAAYMGHTPASHGQTGETAYLLDIEYYNKIMKKLA